MASKKKKKKKKATMKQYDRKHLEHLNNLKALP